MRYHLITAICILLLFPGCNKGDNNKFIPGKIVSEINYRGAQDAKSKSIAKSESFYTRFGDYITSLTPASFKAKFISIRFVDDLIVTNQIELVNNNLPYSDPLRYADFTNNSQVTLNPELGGHLANEGASFSESVTFKYFYFRLEYFNQEVQLPVQYATVSAFDQFYFSSDTGDAVQMAGSLTNNILTAKYRPFILPLFPDAYLQRLPDAFVFGGTDSTYVLELASDPHDFPDNLPYDGDYIIRSNKFNDLYYTPPADESKTTNITITMTFDYKDLIQVYAGSDNIPFTTDDKFVYAPNFWERLSVQVQIE